MNADSIIGPIMQPLAKMFNFIADNNYNEEYARKLEEHERSSMFDPESLLKALSGKEDTQTPSPTLMEKLFEPVIAPVKREMHRIKVYFSLEQRHKIINLIFIGFHTWKHISRIIHNTNSSCKC